MSTRDIIEALYRHYRQRGYLCLHELKPGTGSVGGYAGGIDFWCMHQWPSEKHLRISIEIKVSRSDYLREKAKPDKQQYALMFSNLFYFATPPKLIDPFELRHDAGLLEIRSDGFVQEVRPAPLRESNPPTWNFMAGVMRRLDRTRQAQEGLATLPVQGSML